MSLRKTPLEETLDLGFRHNRLPEALGRLGEYPLRHVRDVQALTEALNRVDRLPVDRQPDAVAALCRVMHQVIGAEVHHRLINDLLPVLGRQFLAIRNRPAAKSENLLAALKVMALYDWAPSWRLITDAAGDGFGHDSELWPRVLAAVPTESRLAEKICRTFYGALPPGRIAVGLLALANRLCEAERIQQHPFDTDEGYRHLERWLSASDREEESPALSAAESVHHLQPAARNNLMALAMDHPNPRVQREAVWASARGGSEAAVKILKRYCLEVDTAHTAAEQMRSLGCGRDIPPETTAPSFAARAEASDFLQQPHVHGRPPELLEVVDERELFWPPTEQRQRLFLIRFEDADHGRGVVLIGADAPRLLPEADPDLPAEDLLALYCSAESAASENPALHPDGRYNLEHGRSLLAKYNRT
ncbi:MAG: hypothetical protein R3236_07770 [Phycisphaeraceae bacterium]|nr:hypothetical protein [Phycisphaeraceae bacterium]